MGGDVAEIGWGEFVSESEGLREQMMEIQSQLAFQEDTINSLNEALAVQQQEILLLRRQIELLKQRQDEQAAGEPGGASVLDEKPPHY